MSTLAKVSRAFWQILITAFQQRPHWIKQSKTRTRLGKIYHCLTIGHSTAIQSGYSQFLSFITVWWTEILICGLGKKGIDLATIWSVMLCIFHHKVWMIVQRGTCRWERTGRRFAVSVPILIANAVITAEDMDILEEVCFIKTQGWYLSWNSSDTFPLPQLLVSSNLCLSCIHLRYSSKAIWCLVKCVMFQSDIMSSQYHKQMKINGNNFWVIWQ